MQAPLLYGEHRAEGDGGDEESENIQRKRMHGRERLLQYGKIDAPDHYDQQNEGVISRGESFLVQTGRRLGVILK